MSKYKYDWDSVNKKKVYMGKYSEANPRGQGYFGRNEAGQNQSFAPKDYGDKLGFKGSNTKEYTFSDTEHGTHTIAASSYNEALRIAESMGYTRGDYKKR